VAGVLGLAIMLGCAGQSARAEDDEDVAPDVKILRHILNGLGLRREAPGIDYRERAPLVLPSSRNLPPPEKATAKAPGWPDDPDVKEAKRIRLERKKAHSHVDGVDDRPLRPSEMSSAPPRPGLDDGKPRKSAEEAAKPMSPQELGTRGLFSLNSWNSLWGSKEEYATFAGEPARESLVDPPTGYRTPSPNQPYGVGKEKWTAPPSDRHVQAK
jgi:hypothetical protein